MMKSVARVVEDGPPAHVHEPTQVVMIFAAALVALTGMVAIVFLGKRVHHGGHDPHHSPRKGSKTALPAHRLVEMTKFLFTFWFAWCMLTGCTWIIMSFQNDTDGRTFGWRFWKPLSSHLFAS